jgi:putative Mg2+ transporter-C (MgtC) family protein
MTFGEPNGQGWPQFAELGLALLLSALIGLEREMRQKSAGLRTYTLVGLASALIILISKYGFTDILADGRVVLDPSRIAAQIVSGIGFIGGGVIFVRKDLVRGLTTATTIWVTAAVGMACGAGLPLLAIGVTGANFGVIYGPDDGSPMASKGTVTVSLELRSGRSVAKLVDKLTEIDGVAAVNAGEAGLISD